MKLEVGLSNEREEGRQGWIGGRGGGGGGRGEAPLPPPSKLMRCITYILTIILAESFTQFKESEHAKTPLHVLNMKVYRSPIYNASNLDY